MFWLCKYLVRAGIVVAFFMPPCLAVAALPPPEKTVCPPPLQAVLPPPLPEPQGRVEHVVEKPSKRRPYPAIPADELQPPPVPEADVQTNTSYEPVLSSRDMPLKPAEMLAPITLTLRDAILLALRFNQSVESSQLTRINDKYNLYLAQRVFVPAYTLGGGATFSSNNVPTYNANAGVRLRTPIGTQFGLNYTTIFPLRNQSSFGTTAFSITQPLLQGFGFVNKIPLLNAYDTEEIAKLNFRSSVITSVSQVMNAYRALVSDYNNLDIQKSNLKNTQIAMNQYRLQLKAGKMSPSDVIAQQAQLSQAQLSYEQQRIQTTQDYRSFLESLGLSLNANINIDRKIDLGNYHIPAEKEAIAVALENNIPYQEALLTLRQTERNIILTQNARLPTLNVVATETFTPPATRGLVVAGGGQGLSLITPVGAVASAASSVVLVNLTVPIDNVQGKANYIAAKIAVMQAKLTLTQTKENLVTTILNDLAQLRSLREQVRISQQSVDAQKKTYENYQLKLKYGKATVFEVTQNQTLYLNQALQLISLEISFLNQITTFDSDLGTTLDAWNIKLRY